MFFFRIIFKSIPKFEYSDEITDFIIFKRLNDSILQVRLLKTKLKIKKKSILMLKKKTKKESLDINLQIEIIEDFKKTNELSEALNALKIIINYAMTTSSDPKLSVNQFMKKIYTELEIKSSESVLKNKVNIFLLRTII